MNRNCLKYAILLVVINLSIVCEACRFTVREIGFSFLSPTKYTLVVVDDNVGPKSTLITRLRSRVKGSNMSVLVLTEKEIETHPFLKHAIQAGLDFPTAFLIAPDNRVCRLFDDEKYSSPNLTMLFDQLIIQSPLRRQLLSDIANTFAFVVRIPGKNAKENEQVDHQIQDDLKRVEDIMSLMPKSVENPPKALLLSAEQCEKEKVVLWCLGLDSLPEHPMVHIVYGRGRYMGNGLQMADVQHGNVYRYLAMVGADCECNLDREWMLGTQLPMLWTADTRQQLASSLDFDVDNPLIQSEMSRILSKEEPGGNSTISFTPETIDLDEVFDAENKPQQTDEQLAESNDSKTSHVLWITMGVLLLIVVFISVYIIRRNKVD